MIVEIEDDGDTTVMHSEESDDLAGELLRDLRQYRLRRKKQPNKISVIVPDRSGFGLEDIACPKPNLDLALHYNNDLQNTDDLILKSLKTKQSGLYLLHGLPGTGKSTYLRRIVNKTRRVVMFLSPRMAANLDSPQLLGLLIRYSQSVLIIEDAEELLSSREQGANSAISTLLNLTDGILGESLGIQIFCTFNTHVSRIDEALLRKGRLIAAYEFGALEPARAQALMESLGKANPLPAKAMTLAEIFNHETPAYELNPARRAIGFGR